MQVAQRLYEGVAINGETVGLITYMRTDGVTMAGEAIAACRRLIEGRYGADYVPSSPRVYKTKAKNAQEAHEAIRPTDVSRRPEHLARFLDTDQRRLYELIWKRTVACQMASAVLDQVAADMEPPDGAVTLRATGSVVAFDGFFTLYRESGDDTDREHRGDNRNTVMPELKEGDPLTQDAIIPDQHFTQPPPRYSEASLVKRLEELGIGRPSTYASILSVLQERTYVTLDRRSFVPEDRGRLVTAFLTSFFKRYVEYTFTAELEERLDDISGGRVDWKTVLGDFWSAFSAAVGETRELRVRDVLEALNDELGPHFFPDTGGADPRACRSCEGGRLSVKLGRYGAFIGCSNYPDCRYTRRLTAGNGEDEGAAETDAGPRVLGVDPATGLAVSLRRGPYGQYVQLGDTADDKEKPKRVSLPKGEDAARVDLGRALGLLSLPREVGVHPQTGETITAGLGRYGPYIRCAGVYYSLKDDDDPVTVGANRAIDIIETSPKKAPAKTLGLKTGRWGPYVQHGHTRANLPKDADPDAATLEDAVRILTAKAPARKKAAGTKARAKRKGAAAKRATGKT
jgi:DNA topoisomerase-1